MILFYLSDTLNLFVELDCKLYTEVSSLANNASSSIYRALVESDSKYVESKSFSLSLSSTALAKLSFTLLIKVNMIFFSLSISWLGWRVEGYSFIIVTTF